MSSKLARCLLSLSSVHLRLGSWLALVFALAGLVGSAAAARVASTSSPAVARGPAAGARSSRSVRAGALGPRVRAARAERTLSISGRSLGLPASARVRALAAAQFERVDQAFELHKLQIDMSGAPTEAAQLRGLRDAAERSIGALPRSKTVVYPMSGYDAGSPIHLFPDAETIIGIDNHPFLPAGEARAKIPYSIVGTHNFAYYEDVDRLGHVGPAVIGALAHAVSGFRLRGVRLIENEELSELSRWSWKQPVASARADKTAVHAIVEFDGGPGTPKRRYVHINASLMAGAAVEGTWWWKAIDALSPDAVLLKASEHVFDSERGMARALRPTVLGWLARSRGVLIEDKDRYGRHNAAALSELVNRPIPTAKDSRSYNNWVANHAGARSTRVPLEKLSFGYAFPGEAIVLTVFDR